MTWLLWIWTNRYLRGFDLIRYDDEIEIQLGSLHVIICATSLYQSRHHPTWPGSSKSPFTKAEGGRGTPSPWRSECCILWIRSSVASRPASCQGIGRVWDRILIVPICSKCVLIYAHILITSACTNCEQIGFDQALQISRVIWQTSALRAKKCFTVD
jgi:hypothetical protein